MLNKTLPDFFFDVPGRGLAKREMGQGGGGSRRSTCVNVIDLNSGTIQAKVGFSEYSFCKVLYLSRKSSNSHFRIWNQLRDWPTSRNVMTSFLLLNLAILKFSNSQRFRTYYILRESPEWREDDSEVWFPNKNFAVNLLEKWSFLLLPVGQFLRGLFWSISYTGRKLIIFMYRENVRLIETTARHI